THLSAAPSRSTQSGPPRRRPPPTATRCPSATRRCPRTPHSTRGSTAPRPSTEPTAPAAAATPTSVAHRRSGATVTEVMHPPRHRTRRHQVVRPQRGAGRDHAKWRPDHAEPDGDQHRADHTGQDLAGPPHRGASGTRGTHHPPVTGRGPVRHDYQGTLRTEGQ